MLRHVSEPHRRAESGRSERMATPPHGDKLMPRTPRKNREFTRRNPE